MPNYKKHLSLGFLLYLFIFYLIYNYKTSITIALQWLICCLIGSLFPDIDTKSKIQKIFYIFLLISFVFLTLNKKLELVAFLGILGLIPLIVNHRGIFHKPWFILLISFIISLTTKIYLPIYFNETLTCLLFFTIGAFSHIYLDLGFKKLFKF